MITEWDQEFELRVDHVGTLPLNQPFGTTDGRRFQLEPLKCTSLLPVRTTEDDLPQADGKIPHRRWRSGYGVHLAINLWQDFDEETGEGEPACDQILIEMKDELGLFLNAMIRTGLVSGYPNARLVWTPYVGATANRMLDRLQLQSAPVPSLGGALSGTLVEVDFDTPYPYYISEAETQTLIPNTTDGFTVSIFNAGNTDYFPVIEAWGPSVYFELINHSVVDLDGFPLKMIYDDSLPGGAAILGTEFVEVVFFTGTAFLNANEANRLANIDFRSSDFFPLVPGENVLELTPGSTDATESVIVKSNDAWA